MKETLEHAVQSSQVRPPTGFLGRVLRRIEQEKIRLAVRRALVLWSSVAVVATLGTVSAATLFFKEAVTSGLGTYFLQFWTLVSTNPSLLFAHWSEVLSSLGEALPATTLAAAAVAVGIMLWSAERVVGFGKRYVRAA